jgi:hypothetical protein
MRAALLVLSIAACTDEALPVDPCTAKSTAGGGEVELLGRDLVPLVEGQDLTAHLTSEYLWTLVMTARTRDLAVGRDDMQGILHFAVTDQNGEVVSLNTGCRVRSFVPSEQGYRRLADPFALPFHPSFNSNIDGAVLTIHLDVLASDGRQASVETSVVSHFPSAGQFEPVVRDR